MFKGNIPTDAATGVSMTANPWDKFFWNDWDNDSALKLCSFAAQGLWMRMLCVCAKAEPKGFLLVAGLPLTPSNLASLVGKPEQEVEALMSELASAGVFSRDRKQRIYNRRMVRAIQKAAVARENGKLGGNPSLRKDTVNSSLDNLQVKPPDKTHKPKANSHKQQSFSLRSNETREIEREFTEKFWPAYPHKVAKPAALVAFRKARTKSSLEEILAGLERYIANKPADRAWCNPSVFLNNERWTDQPAAADGKQSSGWRQNGTGGYVKPGSKEFADHMAYSKNSSKYWDFVAAEKSGAEVHVDSRWPQRR